MAEKPMRKNKGIYFVSTFTRFPFLNSSVICELKSMECNHSCVYCDKFVVRKVPYGAK